AERAQGGGRQSRRRSVRAATIRRGNAVVRRAGPLVRAGGGLSGPQGQSKYDAGFRRTDLDGKQSSLRPAGLQRRGHELQHRAGSVSEQPDRELEEFPAGRTAADRIHRKTRGAEGELHLTREIHTDEFLRTPGRSAALVAASGLAVFVLR